MRPLLASLLFLAAAGAVAQPPIPPAGDHRPGVVRAGESLTVPAGQFADFKVAVPAGASVVWRFSPAPLRKAADLPVGRVIFAGEPGKTYAVTAVVVDFTAKTVTDVEVEVKFAGKAPAPVPPGPTPKPPAPKPPAPKPPEPVTSFRVVLVKETRNTKHTAAQVAVLEGRVVEEWLTKNCTGGKAGWQRRDPDSSPADDETPFKGLWAKVQPIVSDPAQTKLPCVVIERDGRPTIEKLGATPDEMVMVLQKYREGR
jgi:hypothetical protein